MFTFLLHKIGRETKTPYFRYGTKTCTSIQKLPFLDMHQYGALFMKAFALL